MARLVALALGWRAAWDYDEEPALLVVYHPRHAVHFTGATAWRRAMFYSRRKP